MTNTPSIAIVIPVYNDGSTVLHVVGSLIKQQYKSIIVVDDCSDEEFSVSLRNSGVHYLRHRINLGQGAAIQTGLEFAKKINADIVVTFDADGQHDASDVASLIDPLIKDEADIVFGSRFLSKQQLSFKKMVLLNAGRFVNYILSGILLSDAHNGLRALNRKALHSIRLTENRMAHASEFLFLAKQHRLVLREVPVKIRYTSYSRQKGQSGWNGINIFFDLIVHKLLR